jgi:acetyl esterase
MPNRFELAIVRRVFRLPGAWQLRISRRQPLELDGAQLHPNMHMVLSAPGRHGAPRLEGADLTEVRARMHRESTRYADSPTVGSVRDLVIDSPAGPLPARHYAPAVSAAAPLLVFLHGGGFVLGDLETHDLPCRLLARSAATHVLSVAYRLAPEHPFPAALEDAQNALLWASRNAAALGADPARLAIGGDSAGGNLAAVIAQQIARDGGRGPQLKAQLLIYPTTDRDKTRRSRQLFASGFILSAQDIAWFDRLYSAGVSDDNPRVSPLRAADLSGLCPSVIVTAGFDPLRDEGEAYALALRAAGNQVVHWREAQLMHGYIHVAGVSQICRDSVTRMGEELRALLR